MSDAQRYITGVLLTEQGGAPLADATVLVTRGTGPSRVVIGRGRTDGDGRFSARLETSAVGGARGSVSLRVERNGVALELAYGSHEALSLDRLPAEQTIWAKVPINQGKRPRVPSNLTHHIAGTVRHVDGSVPANGTIKLTAKAMGIQGSAFIADDEGADSTYTDGRYVIELAESALGKNVRVVVLATDGTTVLGVSRVQVDVAANPRIDLLLTSEESRGKAEYTVLKQGVESATGEIDDPSPGQLSTDHLLFIAATRNLEVVSLGRYEVAARLAGGLTVPDGLEETDWTEHIFGLVSLGWPSTLPELLSRPWSRVAASLDLAYKKGHIGATAAAQITELQQVWDKSRVTLALQDDPDAEKGSLKPFLVEAGLTDADDQEDLVTEWINHTGTVSAFWEALREHPTLGDAADDVQRALKVAVLVKNHAPMVGKVLTELGTDPLDDLGGMSKAAWVAWMAATWGSGTVGWPSSYTGGDPDGDYADDIIEAIESAFPVRRTTKGLETGVGVDGAVFTAFSAAHDDIVDYLTENPGFDPSGAPVAGDTTTAIKLRRLQRLYRVAPISKRAETIARLFDVPGLRSARDIASRGKKRFREQAVSAGVSDGDALEIFQKARNLSAMAAITTTLLHPSLRRGFAAGVTDVIGEPGGEGAPDVATLFGSQDTCACEPCLSVYSPAAYLVDLLHWVDERGGWSGAGTPPQWALNSRRSDLGQIALSCENTFRVLPYLDLINEVLEDGVAGQSEPPDASGSTGDPLVDYTPTTPSARDTTLTAEELLVTPEYRNDLAYERLKSADTAYFSHTLPHHQDNAEHRAFLGLLGLSRLGLLELGDASDAALAIEELGLCQGDADLITGSQHGARRWGFFGDTTSPTDVEDFIDALTGLRTFRDRSGLDLEAILELLHCRAANPVTVGPPEEYLVVRLDDDCSLDDSKIRYTDGTTDTVPTHAEMARLSRFLRLSRALGGSLLHADRVLAMLDVSDAASVDIDALTEVSQVRCLSRILELDRETVASFFGTIDTWPDRDAATKPQPCLYDRLFMDARRFPAATTAATYLTWPFVLNEDRDELAIVAADPPLDPTPMLADYATQIAAALRTTVSEVNDAITWSGESAFTLAALSEVHRRVRLAVALRRPVREVQQLASLLRDTGAGPVSDDWIFESPADMVAFVDEIGRITALKIDLTTGLYLVAHDDDAVTALRPNATVTQNALGALRDELRSLASDYGLSDEDGTEATETSLTALLHEILGTDPDDPLPPGADFLLETAKGDWYSGGAVERTPRWDDLLDELSTDATSRPLLNLLDLYDLRAKLIGRTAPEAARLLTDQADRYAWLDANLRWGGFRASQREVLRAATAAKLTDLLGRTGRFANRTRELTLSEVWPAPSPDGSFDYECMDAFLTRGFLAFPSGQVDEPYADLEDPALELPDAIQDAFSVFYALHKVAVYFAALGANEDEEEAVIAAASALNLPDPSAFPASAPDDPRTEWQQLRTAAQLMAQAARIPEGALTFAEIMASVHSPSLLAAALSERCGWDLDDLNTLVGSTWFTAGTAGAVEDLRRLLDALDLRDRAGIDISTLESWLTEGEGANAHDATESLATSARDATSAQAGDPSSWVARARPVRDVLRERQRAALLAWLIDRGDSPFDDADEVYEHYLIDVSMGSWLTTSRIQLALASVQLYVQRHLMGLEGDDLDLGDEDREQWQWMKNYRVWEAARKIFMYPENWTDPELRDDESPFYEDLRADLSQGALDDDHVETSALTYLEKLRDVHSLHILSYTRQQETVDDEALDHTHVLARTRGQPPTYYYRRWEDQSTWTPWEVVDVGVEGDNTLLVVYARRLMLFWLTFEQKSDTSKENGDEWYEVRLNWSERKNDDWTPRRVSSEAASLKGSVSEHASASRLSLLAEVDDDGALTIAVIERAHPMRVVQFRLDPCTWSVFALAEDEDFDGDLFVGQYASYQGLAAYAELAPFESATYDLQVPTGSSDVSALRTGTGTVLLTCTDDKGLSPLDVLSVAVQRDDANFNYRTPFFVGLHTRTYLVLPESVASKTASLASTTDRIGLGDLLSFTSLGAAADPVTEDSPDDDAEYDWTGGPGTGKVRSRLSSSLARSLTFTGNPLATGLSIEYSFVPFHHPYVCRFTKEVRLNGIFGLLNPSEAGDAADLARQLLQEEVGETTDFEDAYSPNVALTPGPYPIDEIDFASDGAYASYNWELFFHLPWLVATRLRTDQRYEESLDWLHCIFDPRARPTVAFPDTPARYWKVKPFLEPADADPGDWEAFTGADGDADQYAAFERQVVAWQADPFNPHLLARLRPGTYPKAIFMAYLDTLLAWGDYLFEQDTRESLQEATQIYVLASHLLGDRPVVLPRDEKPEPTTWLELREEEDSASSALVSLENLLPATSGFAVGGRFLRGQRLGAASTPSLAMYSAFCVPPNPKLLGYWDTVGDRLYKIRNGLNLAGERRSLDLFAPPIDPGALVAARANGQGVQSALAAASASLPNHRFVVMHGRAAALAGSVRALGGALLSALEKRDAEAITMLRQGHEAAMLAAVEGVRKQQVDEAEAQVTALEKSKAITTARRDYYQGLIDEDLIQWEQLQVKYLGPITKLGDKQKGLAALAGGLTLIPELAVGIAARAETGGTKLGDAAQYAVQGLIAAGTLARTASSTAGMMASFERRAQEWTQQRDQADQELLQLDAQIAAAELRRQIATRELSNHKLQREQSAEVERWLKSKYTNQSLYQWMCNATAGLYFSAYKLAVDLARQAERCYQYELGVTGSSFIQFGHWDSLRKGLMAGERLAADLDRLDAAYMAGDSRELELVKHISVAELDPLAVALLRETGACWLTLPEALFDLDCPGHYFRRVQAVTLSVACVSGPQANVNLELTLLSSRVRRKATTDEAALVEDSSVGTTTIVTSSARDDGGLFQLDLKDPRYLPFERRGAVGEWQVRLCNPDWPQLDPDSITDIVLHLRYTARDGGETFRSTVLTGLATALSARDGGLVSEEAGGSTTHLAVALSAKRDEPDTWFQAKDGAETSITLSFGEARLPRFVGDRTVTVNAVHVLVGGSVVPGTPSTVQFDEGDPITLSAFAAWPESGASLAKASVDETDEEDWPETAVTWPEAVTVSLDPEGSFASLASADDLLVILEYTVS